MSIVVLKIASFSFIHLLSCWFGFYFKSFIGHLVLLQSSIRLTLCFKCFVTGQSQHGVYSFNSTILVVCSLRARVHFFYKMIRFWFPFSECEYCIHARVNVMCAQHHTGIVIQTGVDRCDCLPPEVQRRSSSECPYCSHGFQEAFYVCVYLSCMLAKKKHASSATRCLSSHTGACVYIYIFIYIYMRLLV